jgi:hypothetical protein
MKSYDGSLFLSVKDSWLLLKDAKGVMVGRRGGMGWLLDTSASRPPSPPRGPMTRASAKAMHQEVNSLLSTYTFDTSLDGMLLHVNTLCSIRYIEQDTSRKDQSNGERDD